MNFLDIVVIKKTSREEFQVQSYYFVLISDISKHNFKHSRKKVLNRPRARAHSEYTSEIHGKYNFTFFFKLLGKHAARELRLVYPTAYNPDTLYTASPKQIP